MKVTRGPRRCQKCLWPLEKGQRGKYHPTCRPQGKYRNLPTTRLASDGTVKRFPSRGEAARFDELQALEKAGVISRLRTQVPYPIEVDGRLVCTYVADFVYVDDAAGKTVVEDYKGKRTEVYQIKKKLLLATQGITVLESGRKKRG